MISAGLTCKIYSTIFYWDFSFGGHQVRRFHDIPKTCALENLVFSNNVMEKLASTKIMFCCDGKQCMWLESTVVTAIAIFIISVFVFQPDYLSAKGVCVYLKRENCLYQVGFLILKFFLRSGCTRWQVAVECSH